MMKSYIGNLVVLVLMSVGVSSTVMASGVLPGAKENMKKEVQALDMIVYTFAESENTSVLAINRQKSLSYKICQTNAGCVDYVSFDKAELEDISGISTNLTEEMNLTVSRSEIKDSRPSVTEIVLDGEMSSAEFISKIGYIHTRMKQLR